MDPITTIVTALAEGAATSKKPTSQAIKDAYRDLRNLVGHLFEETPTAQVILEEYEVAPEVYDKPLKKWLNETHAEQDISLLVAAEYLLKLIRINDSPHLDYDDATIYFDFDIP